MPSQLVTLLPTKKLDSQESKKLRGYKIAAFEEYIAARVLFNTGHIHQACLLANTCIERELKACLMYFGKTSTSHDIKDLFNALSRINPEIQNVIDVEFVKIISKIYRSRYHENLSPGYNFIIVQRKFLAELDNTYDELENMTEISDSDSDGNIIKRLTEYQSEKQANNSHLLENNYLLQGQSKNDFLSQKDYVHEFRVLDSHRVVRSRYEISSNPDKLFNHSALPTIAVTKDRTNSFEVSFFYTPCSIPEVAF